MADLAPDRFSCWFSWVFSISLTWLSPAPCNTLVPNRHTDPRKAPGMVPSTVNSIRLRDSTLNSNIRLKGSTRNSNIRSSPSIPNNPSNIHRSNTRSNNIRNKGKTRRASIRSNRSNLSIRRRTTSRLNDCGLYRLYISNMNRVQMP